MDESSIKDIHEADLIKKKNVNGVGVGVKYVDGKPTNETAILVFVEKKLTKRGISKFSEHDVIPQFVDGIPTDVIEVGQIVKHNLKSRVRPIKPGYSCGHGKVSAGTIGGIFTDDDGDTVILSNNHVLANENAATNGDLVYQPGPTDATGELEFTGWDKPAAQLPYIATLKKFVKILPNNNEQDSAIAKVHPSLLKAGLVDHIFPVINRQLSGFNAPGINMQVQKIGRTTGYTTGRIIGINASFTVGYDFGQARFNNCVVSTAMSKGGDSGSLILDMDMNAVALLFAGSNKVTISTPISTVVNLYGLKMWSPTNNQCIELDDNKWTVHSSVGSIVTLNDSIKITSPANSYCFVQRDIQSFNQIEVTVNTGTDKGASWGPGMSVIWPDGILKVNLRYTGSFAGVYNGNANLGLGHVKPKSSYRLRIRKTANTYIGEVCEQGEWTTVIEIPIDLFQQSPLHLVIGKTNEVGYIGDHSSLGEIGECTFSDLNIT